MDWAKDKRSHALAGLPNQPQIRTHNAVAYDNCGSKTIRLELMQHINCLTPAVRDLFPNPFVYVLNPDIGKPIFLVEERAAFLKRSARREGFANLPIALACLPNQKVSVGGAGCFAARPIVQIAQSNR